MNAGPSRSPRPDAKAEARGRLTAARPALRRLHSAPVAVLTFAPLAMVQGMSGTVVGLFYRSGRASAKELLIFIIAGRPWLSGAPCRGQHMDQNPARPAAAPTLTPPPPLHFIDNQQVAASGGHTIPVI